MKILEKEFVQKGFGYRQVRRDGMFAVYSQHHKNLEGRLVAYETIVIKSHNGYTIGGSYVAPAEMYPGTAMWGKLGWTFSANDPDARKKALDKMAQVRQAEEMKHKEDKS